MTTEQDVKRQWDGIEQTKGGKVLSMVLPTESDHRVATLLTPKPRPFPVRGMLIATVVATGVWFAVAWLATFAFEAK